MTLAARAPRARITVALPWAAAGVALVTLVVGAVQRGGTVIGHWRPEVDALLAVTIACFAGAVALAPRLLRVPGWAFALAAFALTFVLRLALAAGGGGTAQWSEVFQVPGFEGPNEYLPALGALDYGAGFFVDRFAELVPSLPVHAAGHPPGLLLVLHALGIESAEGMAALTIGVGALSGPLAYAVGREPAGRAWRASGRAAARAGAGCAAVRRDVGRCGLPDAWTARRLAARGAEARRSGASRSPSPRSSRGRCSPSAPGPPCWR